MFITAVLKAFCWVVKIELIVSIFILDGKTLIVKDIAFIMLAFVSIAEKAIFIDAPLLDFLVLKTMKLILETPIELLTYAPIK